MGDVNFEANPTLLAESREGQALKRGANLARPITFPDKHEGRDANFEANPAMLKATGKGAVIRQGVEISRPITFPNGKSTDEEEEDQKEELNDPVDLESRNSAVEDMPDLVPNEETFEYADETESEDIVEVIDDDDEEVESEHE